MLCSLACVIVSYHLI